jgi:hypothetical protein
VFVRSDKEAVIHPSAPTNLFARSPPSVREMHPLHASVGSSTRLRARAVDGNAMLTRIASVLGPFSVDHFEYVVGPGDAVQVVVGVRGDTRQVARVAAKINRLIGVHDVVIDAAIDAAD